MKTGLEKKGIMTPAVEHFIGFPDVGTDGPYIIYHSGKFEVITIEKDGNKGFNVRKRMYEAEDIYDRAFICRIDKDDSPGFTFRINPDIMVPPSIYSADEPVSIVAISDIEGNFDSFRKLLTGSGVIDGNLNWIFGKNHLVLLGDFFDRGNNVTPCLWLAYELERQANAAGGAMHFILGNHEEMILQGDKRYASTKYHLLEAVLHRNYEQLFEKNTELGRWLRSKNSAELINDCLFVHGGISPEMLRLELSLDTINKTIRENLGPQKSPKYNWLTNKLLGPKGPLWYRGYYKSNPEYEKATEEEILKILSFYKAKKIITGHTLTGGIKMHYGGKVVAIDVLHQQEPGNTNPGALLIENDTFYALDEMGNKTVVN